MSSNSKSNDHPTEHQSVLDDSRRVSPRQRYRAREQQQRSNGEEEEKKPMTPVTVSSTTASSITDISDDLSTIQKAYRQYKQERIQQRYSSLSALHDIIEDVQFCGIYFCGELFNDTSEEGNQNNDDYEHVISKEERTKAMDTTFLGKMIQCGGIHDGCFSGDYYSLVMMMREMTVLESSCNMS